MVLGIGLSGAFVIEHFHGLPFKKPLRLLREYVDIFNMIVAGEPLDYDGEIFRMDCSFKIQGGSYRDHISVYIAGITPKSIFQTGEISDGIIPIY